MSRAQQYSQAGIPARWLEATEARHAYDHAQQYGHPQRYGLNERSVASIHHLTIASRAMAKAWLADRFPCNGTVQVVYGKAEVAVVETAVFLERWQEMFMPGRDDAIVLHNPSAAVLFYCHEDELEVGERRDR